MNTFTNKHGIKLIVAILLVAMLISAFWTGIIGFSMEHLISPDESSIEYMLDYWKLGDDTTEMDSINALGIYFWWFILIGVYLAIFIEASIFGLLILALVNLIETNKVKAKIQNNKNQFTQNSGVVNINKEQNQ